MLCIYQQYIKYNLKLYVYSDLSPKSPLQVIHLTIKAQQPAFEPPYIPKTAMERIKIVCGTMQEQG